MSWSLLDDSSKGLGPLADLRPIWEIRTGGLTTRARLEHFLGTPDYFITMRGPLSKIIKDIKQVPLDVPTFFVSGRWLGKEKPPKPNLDEVYIDNDGFVISANTTGKQLAEFYSGNSYSLKIITISKVPMLRNPIDLLDYLPDLILHDLDLKNIKSLEQIPATTAVDESLGKVYLGSDVTIGSQVVLQGPIWIESGSVILSRSLIKPFTSIGPNCKVAGEIGATIFQGNSNKSHEGHLGDSWVGEWVNIGAGTNNSNLLNTYGQVSLRIDNESSRIRSGRSFVGCFIGDHVKLGIMSKIMTGTVIGTGSMVSVTNAIPTTVDKFSWVTDKGIKKYRLEKFNDVMTAVMKRRDHIPEKEYLDLISLLALGSRV